MYIRQGLGATEEVPGRNLPVGGPILTKNFIAAREKFIQGMTPKNGDCNPSAADAKRWFLPKTGWWLYKGMGGRLNPGICKWPGTKIAGYDHRDTATTGTVKVLEIGQSGTRVVGSTPATGKELEKLQQKQAEQEAADLAALAAQQAANKDANIKKYLLIGGIAAAGIVALSIFRKRGG